MRLPELQKATNSFNEDLIIGVGGFGKVYKGFIDDGASAVAIKRKNTMSAQGAAELKAEVLLLCQLHHPNLISLIGFCHVEGQMILVYEYMSKENLFGHLYDTDNGPLPCKKRLEICIGAASGLHYLHLGAKRAIVHGDMKTTNILSKMAPLSMSNALIRTDSTVKGTFGYLDLEYARSQQLTEKSDVYLFGVVLLEAVYVRRSLNRSPEDEQVN